METNSYAMDGSVLGKISLSDKIFNQKVNEALLWEVVKYYQANQRQGTAATKTRALVSGGGKKPWRQKGTGRARHGSIRSPIWVGGGVVFGPRPREYRLDVTKSKRRQALRVALSDRAREGKIIVLNALQVNEPKTKIVVQFLKALKLLDKKVLLLVDKLEKNIRLASQNLPSLTLNVVSNLNAFSVLSHEYLIFTKDAFDHLKKMPWDSKN